MIGQYVDQHEKFGSKARHDCPCGIRKRGSCTFRHLGGALDILVQLGGEVDHVGLGEKLILGLQKRLLRVELNRIQ